MYKLFNAIKQRMSKMGKGEIIIIDNFSRLLTAKLAADQIGKPFKFESVSDGGKPYWIISAGEESEYKEAGRKECGQQSNSNPETEDRIFRCKTQYGHVLVKNCPSNLGAFRQFGWHEKDVVEEAVDNIVYRKILNKVKANPVKETEFFAPEPRKKKERDMSLANILNKINKLPQSERDAYISMLESDSSPQK